MHEIGHLLSVIKLGFCPQYPEGESESDYVFIVENPQELTVKFPIKGNPKICRRDYLWCMGHSP